MKVSRSKEEIEREGFCPAGYTFVKSHYNVRTGKVESHCRKIRKDRRLIR